MLYKAVDRANVWVSGWNTKVWLFKWKLLSSSFLWYSFGSNLSLWMKSWSVTIQMKTTEQYFPVVLLIMPYKVVATFESVDEV